MARSRASRRKRSEERPRSRPWVPLALAAPAEDSRRPPLPVGATLWTNAKYTVIARPLSQQGGWLWLSIRRNDRRPLRDWRDLQRIKSEIAGAERDAVELYPAESRLVDTANQYHLWVAPEDVRFPFGYTERLLLDTADAAAFNARQRALPAEWRATD
jgi:hypothetical protein